ncbi:MAG: class I SAM-dependent methyltransferase [Candidatus Aenigmarchaeota archaeon]|nr:class I SAM-dependent methyltransferase [Candidatus Aenigmarchaeota archaeon]
MSQREVWETIADSWTNVRTRPEEEVIKFSKKINVGPILDVGCGNCRNLLPFLEKGLKCVGFDFSRSMIKESKKFLKKRNFNANLVVADMKSLPFKPRVFPGVILVRALPHLKTKEDRIECLNEIKRVGFKIIISCWYKWDIKIFWTLLKHFFSSDVYVDWNYHGKIYKRFHHLYTKKELEDDLKEVGLKIEKIWYKGGNVWSLVSV